MASASGMGPVDVEDLHAHRLKALDQHGHEALHHVVAEIVLGLAFPAEARGIHGDRTRELERLGVIGPAIGWDQPGDADDLALAEGLEGERAAPRRVDLQGEPTVPDQIELIRRLALVEEVLSRLEAHVLRAAHDDVEEVLLHLREERMLADDALESLDLHIVLLNALRCRGWRGLPR